MNKRIINATVVSPRALLPNHAVIIRDDRIAAVLSMESLNRYDQDGEKIRYYDARGGYVMPGFIDIHSDYIEGILQPRPTCLMNFEIGLREAEKQLLGHGVTTIYHSLSMMNVIGSKGQPAYFRTGENFERLALLIRSFHQGSHNEIV
jgi:alpha-D-ribose 1-methylphosphonate 5-triphosphate diphosphatase